MTKTMLTSFADASVVIPRKSTKLRTEITEHFPHGNGRKHSLIADCRESPENSELPWDLFSSYRLE